MLNSEYLLALENKDTKTMKEISNKTMSELANDILFYTFHNNGLLSIKTEKDGNYNLSVTNGDFTLIDSLTETLEAKKT
jgi:hypothetical protein